MIEIIKDFPDNVLAISASGNVTDEDYKKVLIPAAEEKIAKHGRIRVLYHIGAGFERFAPKAMADDAIFGVRHIRHFDRIALVTDVDWIKTAMRAMGFLVPCPVRSFPNEKLGEAATWIQAEQ